MPDIPLLGQNNSEKSEESAEVQNVRTAFMVYITEDGQYILDTDINSPIVPERVPSRDEIFAACQVVQKDMQTQEMLENIPPVMMQFQAAMAQRMQNAQLQQQIARTTR